MNILDKVLQYDDHWTHPEADLTASQISGSSNYQLWLAKLKTPKTHTIELEDRVNAQIGTGFHLRAEQALEEEDLLSEHRMFGEISGVKVSGTADIIYSNGVADIIGDFKTMGHFSMMKLLRGELGGYIKQLSIYAYLWSKEVGNDMETTGEIYALRTGDNKYLSKKDKELYPYGVPRYLTKEIDLLSPQEVEDMVLAASVPTDDQGQSCEAWRCSWCEYECNFRKEKK